MKSFDDRTYKIIFLVDKGKKVAVIDQSYAQDLRPILRKHRYGEVAYTADLFGEGPNRAIPVMYVLQIGVLTRTRLKREIIIWAKVFEKAGYTVRLKPELREQLDDGLFERVFDYEIEHRSIADILEDNQVLCLHHEQDAREKRNNGGIGRKQIFDATTEVLNIRVRKGTSKLFRSFCEETGLTQDRALATLLDLEKEIKGNSVAQYNVLRKTLFEAEKETEATQRKMSELREWYNSAVKKDYLRRKDRMYELRKLAVYEFLKYCPIPVDTKPPIRRYSHKVAQEEKWHIYYEYPSVDGVVIMQLQCASYGQGNDAPLFIFGETLDGLPIKLRFYYRRKDYFGKAIGFSPLSYDGSYWVCAYLVSEEGAADLIGALPLSQSWLEEKKKSVGIQVNEEIMRSILLDDKGDDSNEAKQEWKDTRNYNRADDKIKIARLRQKEQLK